MQVIYVKHGPNNEIGHAYYMDPNGRWTDPGSENKDCFFAALSKIIENQNGVSKSVDDLRNQAADWIQDNSQCYAQALAAEDWIRARYPDCANEILMSAGLHRQLNDGKIKLDPGDIQDLIDYLNKVVFQGVTNNKVPYHAFFKVNL